MEDLRNARGKGQTIVSEKVDWWVFVAPLLFAVACVAFHDLSAAAGWVGDDRLPAWAYALAMVALDVGHTWTTFLLAHSVYCAQPPNAELYWALPFAVLGALLMLCVTSLDAAWAVLAYASMLHYYLQQRRLYWLVKRWNWFGEAALAVGFFGPVAIWHTDPTRDLDWFADREDRLMVLLPEAVYPVCLIVMTGFAVLFLAKAAVQQELNSFGTWFMVGSWVSWLGGFLHHSHTSALLFLTIPHAIPCFVVSYYALKNRWRYAPAAPASEMARASAHLAAHPGQYLGLLLLLALCEEALWEVLVWREWSHAFFPHADMGPTATAVTTAVLLVPQACHLAYDFLLWNDATNPGIGRLLAKPDVYAML
eukprot:TRINITY_DN25141_c0_g1_i1.p1 TRINITY_DN25141_c0_g1~~TRINITY_DN25141_c0_g1_i1.p1  ORF type:complete len:366 (+),score=121.94 TRINITY_DN25141_c0_g1_i1:59-1156(+)